MTTNIGESKRNKGRTLIYVFCIALCKEFCFWIWQEQDLLNTVLKLIAGAAVYMICCGKDYRPSRAEEKGITASVVIFILADLLIKWKFLISGALFIIGHILLIVCFCMEKKPTRKGLAVWVVLTAAEAPLMIRLLGQYGFSPAVGYAGAAYGSVLTLMVVCALHKEKILTAGAIMFACSDLCLALYKASASLWWMHVPSILLFYLALGMFLIFCSGRTGSRRDP